MADHPMRLVNSAELAEKEARILHLESILAQRSVDMFQTWCDGLRYTLDAAAAGRADAQQLLKSLEGMLERMHRIVSPIIVAREFPAKVD